MFRQVSQSSYIQTIGGALRAKGSHGVHDILVPHLCGARRDQPSNLVRENESTYDEEEHTLVLDLLVAEPLEEHHEGDHSETLEELTSSMPHSHPARSAHLKVALPDRVASLPPELGRRSGEGGDDLVPELVVALAAAVPDRVLCEGGGR